MNNSHVTVIDLRLIVLVPLIIIAAIRALARCYQSSSPADPRRERRDRLHLLVIERVGRLKYYDPTEKDPRAQELVSYVRQDNEWKVASFFQEATERGNTQEIQYYRNIVAGEVAKRWPEQIESDKTFSPLLERWEANSPENVDCAAITVAALIHWAWNARTSQFGCHISEERWAEFNRRLELANTKMELARLLAPHDSHLHASRMTIIKGLAKRDDPDTSNSEIEECLASLEDSDLPLHDGAYMSALQYYCEKWFGSAEKMFAFTRSVTRRLPDGHTLWILVLQAHFEHAARYALRSQSQAIQYMRQESVKTQIQKAFNKSLGSPLFQPPTTPWDDERVMFARNWFAYAFLMTGDLELARSQLRIIGNRPSKRMHQWGTLADYGSRLRALGFSEDELEGSEIV